MTEDSSPLVPKILTKKIRIIELDHAVHNQEPKIETPKSKYKVLKFQPF